VWPAAIVILSVIFASLLGFIVLPAVQGQSAGLTVFEAICRSLGLQAGSPAAQQPVSETLAQPVSMVAWTPQIIGRLRHPDLKNGAEIAAGICASCHGETGVSPNPQFPHMAGQSAYAIYKQLHDFKNGARVNETMAAIVQGLDDDQMADVAAHFSALTKGALDPRTISSGDPDIVALVEYGLSARGIPGCASCHGAHAGGPIETPTLAGQRQEYLLAQLNAFAKGERRNDIYTRMRAIASKLRPDEIEKLAEYYAAMRLFVPRN
ncbi:MAG: cytochrome c4, partial [Beijerinckiaceae bacterium]|nr:cytochrome c4 [Beijerinckiaceae bacterium]